MRSKVEQLDVKYLGIKNPKTIDEIKFEILGLETLILEAKNKISQLKQGVALARLLAEEEEDDSNFSKIEK